MKIKIIRIILLVILIADLAFIFHNSAQNSTSSSSASNSVSGVVAPVVVPNYKEMDEEEKKVAVISLNAVIRELAHMVQFMPLGFSGFLLLMTLPIKGRWAYLRIPVTLAFGFICALSDEIHQIFSPGRTFQLFDIGMDMLGVAVGCLSAIILLALLRIVLKKRSEGGSDAALNAE